MYMKKICSIALAMMATVSVFAQDMQEVPEIQQAQAPTDSLGIHPWDKKENDNHIVIPAQAHWSMYLSAGFNVTDADFTSEKKHAVWVPTVGLGAAYHWNNTWSLGLEYKFRNYRVTGSGRECDADIMLKGMSHQANAYVALDIFNMFRPQNKAKLFAFDVLLGGGALWFKNSIQYENERLMSKILTETPWNYNTAKQQPTKMDKYKLTGALMIGASAEFNINRSFQLGLRGVYFYTTTDQVDNRVRPENNDGFFDCEILLRYKFEPRKLSNVRNFMTDETIAKWNNGEYYDDPEIGAAKRKRAQQPQGDGIVVAPIKDTVYIITRDTVFMAPAPAVVAAPQQKRTIHDYVVYFANDDPTLDNAALATINEAAGVLMQETEYGAVIVGSCDNTGAVEYNKWLAVQRATNVTNTLTKDFMIDPSRIYHVGRGIMQDDRDEGSYSLNRRVEIHLVDTAGMNEAKRIYRRFDAYKNVPRTSAVRHKGEGAGASSSRIMEGDEPSILSQMVKEVVETIVPTTAPSAEADTIVVTSDMTLSKLAKQYYGNGNYWYYIYGANRDTLSSPDKLKEGMHLVIPPLSEAKKMFKLSDITKMLQSLNQ